MMMFPYNSPDRGKYRKVKRGSLYLEMRDGVQLAIDFYLPQPLKKGQKLPALLHQTRYWRGVELRWPFSWFSDGLLGHDGKMIRELILNGYAFVNVDCRGSGASFGNRKYPWSPPEIEDGREVADWIIAQPWSEGSIGVIGISYTGTSAEFALTLNHPAIKAAMPLFSLYDVYDDIALPGGIAHDGFVVEWGKANEMLDANKIPLKDPLVRLFAKGVRPVDGPEGRKKLKEAVAIHDLNLHVNETSEGIEFRDQAPANKLLRSMDDFSPHTLAAKVGDAGAAVLSTSGWRDGAYPHSSIRRFLNRNTPVNRLLLGPWDHGGKHHITPGKERKLGAEITSEAVKFFDEYLKGYSTGIAKQPKVQYFTMQEERWKGAEVWPPPGFEPVPMFLHSHGLLSRSKPEEEDGSIHIEHDGEQGTGHYTRWRGLRLSLGTGHLYPDRKNRDQRLTVFDSDILENDLEVTGHPEARIFVRSREADGSFFIYLEDISPGGEVMYVTEGLFRAIHRKIDVSGNSYDDCVPLHSYLEADCQALRPWETTELRFDLLPVSYLFRKGHRIRIAIATGDKDNFKQICRIGSWYELMMSKQFGSCVILPART